MDRPLLTVVITNYNHAAYLPKAIDSLVEQTFTAFEILIIDDASTDNSLEVIDRYVTQYPFIRAIKHEKNRGVCFSLSESVEAARGVYIHTMGADDYRLPTFMEKTMRLLLDNPQIGIACSDFGYVKGESSAGSVLTDKLLPHIQKPIVFSTAQVIHLFQTTDFWVPGHTAILKKEWAVKYGKYPSQLTFLCDWFLLHQIALGEGVGYIPETLSVWWIHSHSYSSNILENLAKKKETYRNVLKILFQKENQKICRLFMRSTLLRLTFKALFWETFYKPRYWPFFLYLRWKTVCWHFKKRFSFASSL